MSATCTETPAITVLVDEALRLVSIARKDGAGPLVSRGSALYIPIDDVSRACHAAADAWVAHCPSASRQVTIDRLGDRLRPCA